MIIEVFRDVLHFLPAVVSHAFPNPLPAIENEDINICKRTPEDHFRML